MSLFRYIDVEELEVRNPLVLIGSTNNTNVHDLGITFKYNSGGVKYTGLYRDYTSGEFTLYDSLTAYNPEDTTLALGVNSLAYATLNVKDLNADRNVNVTGNVNIDGNLFVNGSASTVNSTVLKVQDNIIVANSGPSASLQNAGFVTRRDPGYVVAADSPYFTNGPYTVTDYQDSSTSPTTNSITLYAGDDVDTLANSTLNFYQGWTIEFTSGVTSGPTNGYITRSTATSPAVLYFYNPLGATVFDPAASFITFELYNRSHTGLIFDENFQKEMLYGFPRETKITYFDPVSKSIAVTNGSAVITGTSFTTDFSISGASPFNIVYISGVSYTILSIDSATQITLTQNYNGYTNATEVYGNAYVPEGNVSTTNLTLGNIPTLLDVGVGGLSSTSVTSTGNITTSTGTVSGQTVTAGTGGLNTATGSLNVTNTNAINDIQGQTTFTGSGPVVIASSVSSFDIDAPTTFTSDVTMLGLNDIQGTTNFTGSGPVIFESNVSSVTFDTPTTFTSDVTMLGLNDIQGTTNFTGSGPVIFESNVSSVTFDTPTTFTSDVTMLGLNDIQGTTNFTGSGPVIFESNVSSVTFDTPTTFTSDVTMLGLNDIQGTTNFTGSGPVIFESNVSSVTFDTPTTFTSDVTMLGLNDIQGTTNFTGSGPVIFESNVSSVTFDTPTTFTSDVTMLGLNDIQGTTNFTGSGPVIFESNVSSVTFDTPVTFNSTVNFSAVTTLNYEVITTGTGTLTLSDLQDYAVIYFAPGATAVYTLPAISALSFLLQDTGTPTATGTIAGTTIAIVLVNKDGSNITIQSDPADDVENGLSVTLTRVWSKIVLVPHYDPISSFSTWIVKG